MASATPAVEITEFPPSARSTRWYPDPHVLHRIQLSGTAIMSHTVLAFLLLILDVLASAIEPADGDWKLLEVDGMQVFTDASEGRATGDGRT